jgi:hypothetical protein
VSQDDHTAVAQRGRVRMWFVFDAKTTRIRAGLKVKVLETKSGLSRSTIGRIEGDAGVSEVNAWSYLNALKELVPLYPHDAPQPQPSGSRHSRIFQLMPVKK